MWAQGDLLRKSNIVDTGSCFPGTPLNLCQKNPSPSSGTVTYDSRYRDYSYIIPFTLFPNDDDGDKRSPGVDVLESGWHGVC